MFDIGWTEVLILAVVGLFVIGPKEIPKCLGYVGKLVAKFRMISREFQDTVDEAIHQTELEEIKSEIASADIDINRQINESINPIKNITQPDTSKQNKIASPKEENQKSRKNNNIMKDSEDLIDNKGEKKIVENISKKETSFTKLQDLPTGLKHIKKDNNDNGLELKEKKKIKNT